MYNAQADHAARVEQFWTHHGLNLDQVLSREQVKDYKPWTTLDDVPTFQSMHLGQRKLLLTEFMFLSLVTHKKHNAIVVYAGAAPADHIWMLAKCFPYIRFVLVDPERWNKRFTSKYPALNQTSYKFTNQPQYKINEQIVVIHGYMTNELVQKLNEQFHQSEVVFISDIRPTDVDEASKNIEQRNEIIDSNMTMQRTWLQILNEKRTSKVWAMFKFKPVFSLPKTSYLSGYLFYQPWAPLRSTELRLITQDSDSIVEYDNLLLEKHMAWYNEIKRNESQTETVHSINGKSDTMLEYFICQLYIHNVGLAFGNVLAMMKAISKELDDKDLHFGLHCFETNWEPNLQVQQTAIKKILDRDRKYTEA